jgi:tRNA G18 (ribose-2'-O)-methylase SpoU
VVESRLVVRELVAGRRFAVRSVLCTEAARADLGDVLAGVPQVLIAPDALIRRIVGFQFHGGCLAVAERGRPPSLDAVLAPAPQRLVVLERVSNPDNVGGVFRNARAFGADAVILGPGCTDPLSRKAIRAAMGASLVLPFATAGDWPAALARLQAAGLERIALSPRSDALAVTAFGATRPRPARFALLVGAEGPGLGSDALGAADVVVRIPMAPGVDSLNVATATGIALHRLTG